MAGQTISVQIENIDKIREAFARSPEIVGPFLRDASMKSGFLLEGASKKLSPVDTGRMRSSIATSLGILNKGIQSIVSTNVFYAIFVHDGTKRMRGRPFMRQAVDQNVGGIQAIYTDEITKAMNRMASDAS